MVAPPASSGSVRTASPEGSHVHAYLEAIDPYLSVGIGKSKRFVELGNALSRNVLELSIRMDGFREASAELQAFVAANQPPEALRSMVMRLMDQLASADEAINSSIEAVRSVDWGSLGKSVDLFTDAIMAIGDLSGPRHE